MVSIAEEIDKVMWCGEFGCGAETTILWVEVGEEVLVGVIKCFFSYCFWLGGLVELLEGVNALLCIF